MPFIRPMTANFIQIYPALSLLLMTSNFSFTTAA